MSGARGLLEGSHRCRDHRPRFRAHAPADAERRGYRKLYVESVLQADQGCDFGFLQSPQRDISVPRA